MRKHLLILFILLVTMCQAFAQGSEFTVTGKVLDSQTKEPLIGASILAKGTSKATSVSLNGTFKLKLDDANATLVISYIGYISKEIPLNGKKDLGLIEMVSNTSTMSEVTVTSDLAIDRKTPIAVSTISAEYIEEKSGSQELPELLKETPGVMATETGGGYGDSRISIRGFQSNNVALLINGIPANDVEAGKIFWSDWAGLTDVASSIQVQRGLGASKLAVPSLGGTIGITTRSTDAVQGGTISQSIGSYGDQKTSLSLSTGLNSKGWAASFLLAKRSGDGKAFGLYYTGYSYFLNISKVLTKHQSLAFNILGAAQSHGQRYTEASVSAYRNSPDGIRFNPDWGYLNGTLTSAEINYYNKPLASLTHNWIINESSSLSTTLYASFGAGAARYLQPYNYTNPATDVPRVAGPYSPIDFTAIQQANESTADGSAKYYIQNNVNNHQQYGATSKYNKKLGNFDFLAGADLRYYTAAHYFQVQNLLGAQYMIDPYAQDVKNVGYHLKVGDRFDQNYVYNIASEGLFLQTEYSKNDLSAFVALAATNTGNQRIDYFSYQANDPAYKSNFVNFWGYQTKGGLNYNLDSHNNVFANIGYLQRAPLVSSIFLDFRNDVNPDAKPEKLLSYELGYGFRSSQFTANINVYRSTYKDHSVPPKDVLVNGILTTANITGLNELHQGVEFDSKYRPFKALTLRTMLSVGDWHYLTNTDPITIQGNNPTSPTKSSVAYIPGIIIQGTKVGDAAQTTASAGADVYVLPGVKLGATYNYYGNYTTSFNPIPVTFPGYTPYKLPNYSLLDLNMVFRLKIDGLEASFIGNVNNVLDTKYFSDAYDISPSSSFPNPSPSTTAVPGIGVYYGIGRTYTATFKVKF